MDLADPIELKLGNYLHLGSILGPTRAFFENNFFSFFWTMLKFWCVLFAKIIVHPDAMEFLGGKYSGFFDFR